MESRKNILLSIFQKRKLIFELSKLDFKKKHAGSYFGIIWSFVQPLLNVLMLWVVFSLGFRTSSVIGVPFIVWLICGLVPWYFFSEALSNSSGSIIEYRYLLTQIDFKSEILPIVKIVSSSFVHFFFIFVMLLISIFYRIDLSLSVLQIFYYLICLLYLLVGLGWLFSCIKPFFPDISELVSLCLQIGFWYTPCLWNISMIPEKYRWIFVYNPLNYIVQGYREALINKTMFWEKPKETFVFFIFSTVILLLGNHFFERLEIHFNDVL